MCPQPPTSVEFIDPLANDEWDMKITARPDHSVFHRSAWARVLAETYGHRPFYCRVMVSGVEVALIPLMEVSSVFTGVRAVSLPFADFCGPLWTKPDHEESTYRELYLLAGKRGWKHVELRGGSISVYHARSFQTYEAHELDLSVGIGGLERLLRPATRRAIHKAGRSGLIVSTKNSEEALLQFYHLHARTRRRHGLPPQPLAFFWSVYRNLIENGLGFIVLAYFGKTAVAGAVFLMSGPNAIYKFGASEINHWGLRPNHLVMWTAMQCLVENGSCSLHLGRTSTDNLGLGRFKNSWTCMKSSLSYYRYHVAKMTWMPEGDHRVESHPFLFGRLPIALNRIAGRIIYPHLD